MPTYRVMTLRLFRSLACLTLATLLAATAAARTPAPPLPAKDDLERSRASANGLFRVTLAGQPHPAPLGGMQEWELLVTLPDGAPVVDAKIAVAGNMPDRDHPMRSEPKMTRGLGQGYYRIEGVKFDRQGWWHLKFAIEADGKTDNVAFSIMVGAISHAEWSDERSAPSCARGGSAPGHRLRAGAEADAHRSRNCGATSAMKRRSERARFSRVVQSLPPTSRKEPNPPHAS
jgi:hypothetical protein